jgi:hypothetical protein
LTSWEAAGALVALRTKAIVEAECGNYPSHKCGREFRRRPGRGIVAVSYDSLTSDQKGNKIEKIALPGASKDQLENLMEFRCGT